MLNPRTPGVYVQELSLLPPSVAPVATAIPAFIGYTQKRGGGFPEDTPKRITSLVDFEETFGGPFDENYTVTLAGDLTDPTIAIAGANAPYLLYYAVQHYFANGGGPCHIISVGLYDHDNPGLSAARLTAGVDAAEQEDEPTLLVVPEAVGLDSLKRTDLHNQMLAQCNKMQDRFALMDALVEGSQTPLQDANAFRDEVGIENLKYGAAYYPSLQTTITKYYDLETVNIQDDRGGAGAGSFQGEPLSVLKTGSGMSPTSAEGTFTVNSEPGTAEVTVAGQTITFTTDPDNSVTATDLASEINGNATAGGLVTAVANANVVEITADAGGTGGNSIDIASSDGAVVASGATLAGGAEGGRIAASATLTITSGFKKIKDTSFTIGTTASPVTIEEGSGKDFEIGDSSVATATAIADAINGAVGMAVSANADGTVITLTSKTAGVSGNDIELSYDGPSGARFSGANLEGGTDGGDPPNVALYLNIISQLNDYKVDLYPSAAMAGIYARVDRNRGVWKAPANVSVNQVRKTNVIVSGEEQELLNIDPNTGKSVNVIRPFAGKGILVWGSRTLAGNDNEWRYVPVRRLFIFIEESIQKASEPFVFEPNDANTWIKMKGMIENFLTSLWREGALAGAVPSDAFFVKVGLGETMSAVDILEGKLNVEVGIAAVRPAEFIILKFSHKLQES